MEWKNALYALAVGDPTHGECFVQSAAPPADHYACKYLNSFLVPFYHAGVNTHTVTHSKLRRIALLLFFLDGIHKLIHKETPFLAQGAQRAAPPAEAEGHFHSEKMNLQIEFV